MWNQSETAATVLNPTLPYSVNVHSRATSTQRPGPAQLISLPDESGPYLVVGPSVCLFFGNRLLNRGRKGLALSLATQRG